MKSIPSATIFQIEFMYDTDNYWRMRNNAITQLAASARVSEADVFHNLIEWSWLRRPDQTSAWAHLHITFEGYR